MEDFVSCLKQNPGSSSWSQISASHQNYQWGSQIICSPELLSQAIFLSHHHTHGWTLPCQGNSELFLALTLLLTPNSKQKLGEVCKRLDSLRLTGHSVSAHHSARPSSLSCCQQEPRKSSYFLLIFVHFITKDYEYWKLYLFNMQTETNCRDFF